MRFYSIQPSEIDQIDNETAEILIQCIDVLSAEEQMVNLKNADFPNMKDGPRSSFFNVLKNRANPSILRGENKSMSTEDIARLLKG